MNATSRDHDSLRKHRRRLGWFVVPSLALVATVAAAFLFFNGDDGSRSSTSMDIRKARGSIVPETTSNPRDEVISRLREIFEVRDRAIESRRVSLLEGIYTVDCPCLEGDKRLIEELRRSKLEWRGVNVSLEIQHAERLNTRLWTVSAVINTRSFDIVTESGKVVRRVPGGRELSRFALTKFGSEQEWLLGQASVIEERD